MYTLKLKSVKIGNEEVQYESLISTVSKSIPQGSHGFDLGEQRRRIRILDVVEKLETPKPESVTFEDQDAELLKTLVKTQSWMIVDRGLVQFCEDVEAMTRTT